MKPELDALQLEAERCRIPKHFRQFVTHVRAILPFNRSFACWGYPSRRSLIYLHNQDFPRELVSWYFSKGALWDSPVFRDWLIQNKSAIWIETVERIGRKHFDPEVLEHLERYNLQYSLYGGKASIPDDFFIVFMTDMENLTKAHDYLPLFSRIVPWLVQASQQAYPAHLLTVRERLILEKRALGLLHKQIAGELQISERTVRQYLTNIKLKLQTPDLTNAVVMATQSGMILRRKKDQSKAFF